MKYQYLLFDQLMYNIMSGIANNLLCQESSESQQQNGPSFRKFDLENEEVLRFVFNEKQIFMDPEDHLSPFFINEQQPSDVLKKEESDNANYIYSFNSDLKNSLNEEYELARLMMDRCRVVQQIILSTSKESIYDYDIGFDSQNEDGKAEDSSTLSVIKEEKDIFEKTLNPQTEKQSNDFLMQKLMEGQMKPLQECELKIQAQSFRYKRQNHKFAVVLTLSDFNIKAPFTLSEQLDLIKSCYSKPVSIIQKKKFLLLFEKLESIRKGILAKTAETKGNQHACKVCNMQFASGRMLGGHMSRKHPGNSFEYQIKKQVHITKECERNRRIYFKKQKTKKIEKSEVQLKLKQRQ